MGRVSAQALDRRLGHGSDMESDSHDRFRRLGAMGAWHRSTDGRLGSARVRVLCCSCSVVVEAGRRVVRPPWALLCSTVPSALRRHGFEAGTCGGMSQLKMSR